MKQLLTKFIIISLAAIIFAGVSSYYSNNAKADIILSVMISINDQKPWTETFNWENFLPGHSKKITLNIKNIGTDTAYIWTRIENLTTEENGITEPENEWYGVNGIDPATGKNDADSAIIYDLRTPSDIIVDRTQAITLSSSKIKDNYFYLGKIAPGGTVSADEGFFLKNSTENWMQSDKIVFDIEVLALSFDAPPPTGQ